MDIFKKNLSATIITKLIAKGVISPEHKEIAIEELERELQRRVRLISSKLAVIGAFGGALAYNSNKLSCSP